MRIFQCVLVTYVACSVVSGASAAVTTCQEIKDDIAALETQLADDEKLLADCIASPGACTSGDLKRFQAFLKGQINRLKDEIRADQTQLVVCPNGPPAHLPAPEDVLTYHYNGMRTGWNPNETILTPDIVSTGEIVRHYHVRFQVLVNVTLDERVSAQPLVISNQWVEGRGYRDVVYVVTEGNTIYAIDATTGAILKSKSLGPPVPNDSLIKDDAHGDFIGITSTPVIDTTQNALYLISFTMSGDGPTHLLHKIDLSTLDDQVSPVMVLASYTLTDGTVYGFRSQFSLQRPGLVAANGNIYAAFGSFADHDPDRSRGWLLGWNATTLSPLAANYLVDQLHPYVGINDDGSRGEYYLSSIWMSGYGVASDPDGNLFVTTGNSGWDHSGGSCTSSFSRPKNLAESAVKLSGHLTILGSFTADNFVELDCTQQQDGTFTTADLDFGAGGIMLLPQSIISWSDNMIGLDTPEIAPRLRWHFPLAIAAGKDWKMYLLNRDNMQKFASYYSIGGSCWCGPTYFVGSDGAARVISSGGSYLKFWKLTTTPETAYLEEEHSLQLSNSFGFFTSVSSHWMQPNTAIIWAVTRIGSMSGGAVLTLHAFDEHGNLLYESPFGRWPGPGLPNIVPVVAKGKVYAASDRQLTIFGLAGEIIPSGETIARESRRGPTEQPEGGPWTVGVVTAIQGQTITLLKRDGSIVSVDASKAFAAHKTIPLSIGKSISVRGRANASGTVEAESI